MTKYAVKIRNGQLHSMLSHFYPVHIL